MAGRTGPSEENAAEPGAAAAPPSPSASAPTSAPKKPRDPLLDNARALLIALVVVGHTLEKIDTPLANVLYTWIYSFHMPAFVLITGFLSRSYRHQPRQVGRLLTSMLIPYLIFQIIHTAENTVIEGDPISISLWDPAWTLWFLLALVIWRLLTPVLRVLRYPLILTVAISVLAPLDSHLSAELTWGRVLSFLPFFTLGLMATPEHLRRLRDVRGAKLIGGALLLAALLVAWATHDMFSTDIFTMSHSYAEDGMSPVYGVVTRVLVLVCGTALAIAVVMLSPRRHHWFTVIGVQSLTIYLVHAAILQIPRNLDLSDAITTTPLTLLAILAALALVVVLSLKPVVRVFSWITSPPVERLLVREEAPADAARAGR
jgi:fucose 4-O-acetylase-like acetyltransferase